jgi:hypothetical protein
MINLLMTLVLMQVPPVTGPEPIPPTFLPPTRPQFRPPMPVRPPPGGWNGGWVWDARWGQWRWNDDPRWNDWHWWDGRWHFRRHPPRRWGW